MIQRWQCKGGGFAGTCLCNSEEVAIIQEMRNGLHLDRCGRVIPLFGDGLEHLVVQAEIGKCVQVFGLTCIGARNY